MVKQTSKTSNVGDALVAIGAVESPASGRKLTDAEKAKAAAERASKVLHANLRDTQYALVVSLCDAAKEHTIVEATWVAKAAGFVAALYTEADKTMLLGKGGAAHIKAVGNAIAAMSGTTWARRNYRNGVQLFLFGKDSDKKLPGARRVKSLPAKDVARYSIDSYQRIVGYVKRIDRKNVEATDLAAITDAMKTIAEGMAVLRKACSR